MVIDVHRPNHRASAYNALRNRLRAAIVATAGVGMRDIGRGTAVRFAFIVGCGHSGTSLLASRLGLHPQAFLVDGESYAFVPTVSAFRCRREVLGWARAAEAAGRSLVIEKTPKHVHSITRIMRLLPGARVVAMVRNPLDSVASMKQRFGSLELAVERWNLDNAAVARIVAGGVAVKVRYEDLTTDPPREFARALGHVGLGWDPSVLLDGQSAYSSAARNLLKDRVEQVSRPITARSGRWREALDESEAAAVLASTADVAARLGYSR